MARVMRRHGLAAAVLLSACLVAVSIAVAEPRAQVHLTLREVSAAPAYCTLDVTTNSRVGEVILSCGRPDPDSHLGAHRPLTASEAARLHALTEQMPMQPLPQEAVPTDRPVGPRATLLVRRGDEGVNVDVSQGPTGLSDSEREIWQILRSFADELRGMKR